MRVGAGGGGEGEAVLNGLGGGTRCVSCQRHTFVHLSALLDGISGGSGWGLKHTHYSFTACRPEVQDQGSGRVGFW